MPVRCAIIDHTDASTIYLGTEIGVYKKAMADSSWVLYNTDMPNMTVLEMEVMYGSNTLRAATWGRGLYEYTLDGRQNYPSILTTRISDQPTFSRPSAGVDQLVTSTIAYDSTITSAYVEWSLGAPAFGNVISMSNTVDSTWVSDNPIPGQPVGTKVFFKVFAVGAAGDTTETYKFMYEVQELAYCESFGNMAYQTAITLVDFNGIYRQSGKTQPYTDYTTTDSSIVDVGNSYDLNVWLNTDGNFTIYSKVWIDWNQDYDFEDAGEEYDLGTAVNTPNGPTTFSPVNVTVPINAQLGKTTMRVSARYNTAPDACGSGYDGEVEDYTVIVQNPTSINETGAENIKLYPNPVSGLLTIELKEPVQELKIEISNSMGQLVEQITMDGSKYLNVDMTNYKSGIYFVNLITDEKSSVFKITKE